ncbi:MAG: Mut7-C ubiquitin [Symbiobacteriaceae bacterium]|jgi:sulfur carrier protein ThiS|nr:Mut7-C ubiquitin [Symbiobacteriaceae bacterium]
MQVTIRAQGHLKQYRQTPVTLDLPEGATVRMMLDASGIPWAEVGLVAVNGKQAPDEAVLHNGDEVMLLAPMEGG